MFGTACMPDETTVAKIGSNESTEDCHSTV